MRSTVFLVYVSMCLSKLGRLQAVRWSSWNCVPASCSNDRYASIELGHSCRRTYDQTTPILIVGLALELEALHG